MEIKKGDSLYVSSSFGMLGLPSFKISNDYEISRVFFEILIDILGNNGTLFAPTFTYSFSKTREISKNVFNVDKTTSRVGPFGEYIRKKNNSLRSEDPMISITGYGKGAGILLKQQNTSYGKGCIFDQLRKINNLKILNLGVGANYIPFIHFVDYLSKCHHRFNKYFEGFIIKDKRKSMLNGIIQLLIKKTGLLLMVTNLRIKL